MLLPLICGFCWSIAAQELYSIDPNNNTGADISVFPQLRHIVGVESIAFSSDGRYIVSSSSEVIKLWDAASGREIRSFTGHSGWVNVIALSPDDKHIASGSCDKTIKLWDVASGDEIRSFTGHSGWVNTIAFSPDGKQIVSGSYDWYPWDRTNTDVDDSIRIWDTDTGHEIRTIKGHSNSINSVAFSPDGKQIVSGSEDKTIKLWDASTGQEIRTFSGYSKSVKSAAFSPDGRFIVSCAGELNIFSHLFDESPGDNTIKLWDASTGREIKTFSGHQDRVNTVVFSSDGKQIISGSSDKSIKIFNASTGRVIRTISDHQHSIQSIAFNSNGRQIAAGYGNGTIKLWNAATGREIRTMTGNQRLIYSAAFSPDKRHIVFGLNDGTVKLWDITTGRETRTLSGHSFPVDFITFSPDGSQILSGASDNTNKLWNQSLDSTVKLWDTNTGREIRTFSRLDIISSLMFSPDGKEILIAARNNRNTHIGGGISLDIYISDIRTIKLYETATGREIKVFQIEESQMDNIAYSPNGKYILICSGNSLKLFDVFAGNNIWTYTDPAGWVNSAEFSPDGKQMLASFGNTIKLWDVLTGRKIWIFKESSSRLYSAEFSSSGKQIFTISDSGTKLWDIARKREIRTITGHFFRVRSPDDRRAVTFSLHGTMILKDTSTGKEIAQFISFNDGEWLVITPDGYYNASPNGDIYLNVRVGNNVYGIDQYRSTYYKPQIVEARLQGRPDPGNRQARTNDLPNLWILSIGVNRYDSTQLSNLNYAANDASEIIKIFKAQEGRVYNRVSSLLINDNTRLTAKRDNVIEGFSFLKQAKQGDVILLFISGHGVNDENGNFYFLPNDASFNIDGTLRTSMAISYREIQAALDVPAAKLIFFDVCRSNNTDNRRLRPVDNNRLVSDLQSQNQNTIVFISSHGNQPSHEMDNLRHGAFTYAIIQGMRGEANPDENGVISMLSLSNYVSKRANEITSNSQTPTISIPEELSDFIVARIK